MNDKIKFAILRSLVSQVVILAIFMALWISRAEQAHAPATEISYSELLIEIEAENIEEVTIEGRKITAVKSDGSLVKTTRAMPDDALFSDLADSGIKFQVKDPQESSNRSQRSVALFPALLAAGLWIYFVRRLCGLEDIFSKRKVRACSNAVRNRSLRPLSWRHRHRCNPSRRHGRQRIGTPTARSMPQQAGRSGRNTA